MNKKTLALIILLIFLGAAVGIGVYFLTTQTSQDTRSQAAPATTLSLDPTDTTSTPGQTVTLNVIINTSENSITAAELDLSFDPSIVTVSDFTAGPFIPGANTIPAIIDNAAGTASFDIFTPVGQPAAQGSGILAVLTLNTVAAGTSDITFDPTTLVTAVTEEQNVLIDSTGASITVSSVSADHPSLTLSAPSSQTVGTPFTASLIGNSNDQLTSGIDAVINFDPNVIEVTTIDTDSSPFASFPVKNFDNTAGTLTLSANVGINGTPLTLSDVGLASITFTPIAPSTSTTVTFDFTLGSLNDTNIAAELPNGDSIDILVAVNNLDLVIAPTAGDATPTPIGSATPTPTPIGSATPTPTPIGSATPTPTSIAATPTSTPPAANPTNTPLPTTTDVPAPTPTTAASNESSTVALTQTYLQSGTSTADSTPTLGGAATAGRTITLTFTGAASFTATTTALTNNTWSYTPSSPLVGGSYSVAISDGYTTVTTTFTITTATGDTNLPVSGSTTTTLLLLGLSGFLLLAGLSFRRRQ